MASTSKRYLAEPRDRAVRKVAKIRSEHGSKSVPIQSVAEKLEILVLDAVNWTKLALQLAQAGGGRTLA